MSDNILTIRAWYMQSIAVQYCALILICNSAQCKFCFHTAKSYHALPIETSAEGLRMLKDAGCEKINFAGGEPFLHPILKGELCQVASNELDMAVSIISNGSQIYPEWMDMYAKYVDVLGVSVDSFDHDTNAQIGRGGDANNMLLNEC